MHRTGRRRGNPGYHAFRPNRIFMQDVLLFIPCYVDLLFPRVGRAAVSLLEAAGCRVHYPSGQTCCGQPALNSGFPDEARAVACRFAEVFSRALEETAGEATIVAPSASCVAMVDHEFGELGVSVPARVRELCTFLVEDLGVETTGVELEGRAALSASCHQLRHLGGDGAVRRLLATVSGLELLETGEETSCCGFGGTFSASYPDVSSAMGNLKIEAARRAEVDFLITTDASCGMQLSGLARRQGETFQVVHAAEVLAGMVS